MDNLKEKDLKEAMKFWTVTITKKAGKLFKGQTVDVKARSSAEAIKKGIKQMKGNPALVPSGSVDAILAEVTGQDKAAAAATAGAAALGVAKLAKRFSKKGREAAKDKKLKKALEPFDDKIEKHDDLIKDIQDRLSDLADDLSDIGKVGKDVSLKRKKEQITKRMDAGKEKLKKVQSDKRKTKEAKRKAKEKITGVKTEDIRLKEKRIIRVCSIVLGEDFEKDFIYEDISFDKPREIFESYLKYISLSEKKIAGLVKKAEKSGMPYGVLKQVYNRGMAAWKGGHRPGTTPQQWAFARVNSFITKSKGTWGGADQDLARKVRGESVGESTAEYAKSLEKIANDKRLKQLTKKDRQTLDKLVALMKKANEEGIDISEIDWDPVKNQWKGAGSKWMNENLACPTATQNLEVNTKNRDAAIKKFNYGPLNVNEPGTYWKDIAKYWKTTEEAAKQSLCESCVAFDISPRMKDCMPGETSDDDGFLGYCWMHYFKCHSARSCHTWAKGGPIVSDETSLDWQERSKT